MKIDSIRISGFKSYKDNTIIDNLSSHLNAIIGENGCGKSNLFDSICFLLGYRSSNELRVAKAEDFIFKQGQYGVTYAYVSIQFDNSDKNTSPLLYKNEDKITITRQLPLKGKNRYFVNGVQKKPSDVRKLLIESGINVNSGNFIVMQGKVQSVINMKPIELYALLSETLGTSVFDKESQRCGKVLEEKKEQLRSIQNDLEETIEPAYQKCLQQRNNYNDWMILGSDIDCLNYLLENLQYTTLVDKKRNIEKNLCDAEDLLQSNIENKKNYTHNLEKLQYEYKNCEEELKQLELTFDYNSFDKDYTQLNCKVAVEKDNLERIEEHCKELRFKIEQLKQTKTQTELKINEITNENKLIVEEHSKLLNERDDLQKNKDNILNSLELSKKGSLLDENGSDLNIVYNKLTTELSTIEQELSSKKAEYNYKMEQLKKIEVNKLNFAKLEEQEQEIKEIEALIESNQAKLKQLNYNKITIQTLEEDINNVIIDKNKADERYSKLYNRFKTEEKILDNFTNRSTVYGTLMDCFNVSEKHDNFLISIEECVKNKLCYIVVDNDKTASEMFKFAKLNNIRITCIPINVLNFKRNLNLISDNAKEYPDVYFYSEVITYDKIFKDVMSFVFNNCYFCKTNKTAKTLYILPGWKNLIVIEDGTIYDPVGRITGGSSVGMNNLIKERKEFLEVRKYITELNNSIENLKALHKKYTSNEHKYIEISHTIDSFVDKLKLKVQNYEMYKASTSEGIYLNLKNQTEILNQAIKEYELNYEVVSNNLNECKKNIKKHKNTDYKKLLETQLHDVEIKISSNKANLEVYKKKLDQKLLIKLNVLKDKIIDIDVDLNELSIEHDKQLLLMEQKSLEYNNLLLKYTEAGSEMSNYQKKVQILTLRTNSLKDQIKNNSSLIDDISNNIIKIKKECEQLKLIMEDTRKELNKHNQNLLSKANAIDKLHLEKISQTFELQNEDAIIALINKKTALRQELQLGIDKKSIEFLSQLESKYINLVNDKKKIEDELASLFELIETIHKKKQNLLHISFRKLNATLSYIYSQLMADSSIALDLLDETDISKGFQFNISFGEFQKHSLTDLSGGQKTIVSLSLMLSLLKLTPSTFYIFDEIDAALDINSSHNLGELLKNYFSESQFIIISHRQAFYKHADILYKVSCNNGISTVTELKSMTTNVDKNKNQSTKFKLDKRIEIM